MPQGKVVAVEPIIGKENKQLDELLASLEAENKVEYITGDIITCKKNPGEDIELNEVLPFFVPETDFPNVETGTDCNDSNATNVKFKFRKEKGVKYIYEVKLFIGL